MKRTRPIAMILALLLALSACGAGTAVKSADVSAAESKTIGAEPSETAQLSQTTAPASPNTEGETVMDKITLSFNGCTYTATLADNPSAKAFATLLKDGPLTVSTHDYGSFEKVGSLGTELPRTDEQITTAPGTSSSIRETRLRSTMPRTPGASPVWVTSTIPAACRKPWAVEM